MIQYKLTRHTTYLAAQRMMKGSALTTNTDTASPTSRGRLTIVIPALNEEEAIGGTIQNCLDAREPIKRAAQLEDVEIIVVSDGSTDKTVEIARGFDDIQVIEFVRNRGYGAAIKEGWALGHGDLVGFLDGDGTCDASFFGRLCTAAKEEKADVVLGSRLGPDSKMPAIRRLGNRIYAALLGLLCGHQVTDAASGMRVVSRSSLKYLYPLPDGLHFTPSMSAKALMNGLRVVEIPMHYEERIGKSKLHVVRDGLRFFRTILESLLCYKSDTIFLTGVIFCVLMVLLLGLNPTEFYFRNWRLEDWMIYRFVGCTVFASVALLLTLATAFSNRLSRLGPRRKEANAFWPYLVGTIFSGRKLLVIAISFLALGLFLIWGELTQWIRLGTIEQSEIHWSRPVAAAFCLTSAIQTVVFAMLMKVIDLWIDTNVETEV